MPRSKEEQASRRSSPYSIGKRDPSLKWPHLYDLLRAKGYDKEKSARISNSRVGMRKKGKLEGLPWRQANSRRALKGVLKTYQSKHGRTASALVAACYSKICAPPPVGRGGSIKGTSKFRRGSGPVQHPELLHKVRVPRRFEKLMRSIALA